MGAQADSDTSQITIPRVHNLDQCTLNVGIVLFAADSRYIMYKHSITGETVFPQGPRLHHETSMQTALRLANEAGYPDAILQQLKMKSKQFALLEEGVPLQAPFAITHRIGPNDVLEITEWFICTQGPDNVKGFAYGGRGIGRDWSRVLIYLVEVEEDIPESEREVGRLATGFFLDENVNGKPNGYY